MTQHERPVADFIVERLGRIKEELRQELAPGGVIPKRLGGLGNTSGIARPVDHNHTGTGDGGALTKPSFDNYLRLAEIATPTDTPAAGERLVYPKADGHLYRRNPDGSETQLTGVGGGGGGVTVREVDGVPSIAATALELPNGTLTEPSAGVARYTPSGGGSGTIHTNAYGSPPASPADGDIWIPAGSPYTAYRAGGAWRYRALGYDVTPPPAITGNPATGFTWVNQGNATADESRGGILLTVPPNATSQSRNLLTNAPATPYTIMAFVRFTITGTNYAAAGLYAREAASGKLAAWVLASDNGWRKQFFNSPGAFLSEQVNVSAPGWFGWLYIRDDGTNREYGWSTDGSTLQRAYSEARTAHAVMDQVGIGMNVSLATYTITMRLLSWRVL